MKLEFTLNNTRYYIDSEQAVNIAIEQDFSVLSQEQVNFFAADKAVSKPFELDGFIGDTDKGGSCNVPEIRLNIHCNGTHTESKQHIDKSSKNINAIKIDSFLYSKLITVDLYNYSNNISEGYSPGLNQRDIIITSENLMGLLSEQDFNNLEALVIRTLPNNSSKKTQKYTSESDYAFLTNDAIELINSSNIKHILIDTPSLDRSYGSQEMSNHHLYWEKEPDKTVTELVYVDNNIQDDYYILNLQIPNFALDAAPSRPLLYKIYKD